MRESVFDDPAADGLCHAVKFGIGAAFDVIVALQFERDIVRPTLGAIDKAVVEGGHSSWRIYTKCAKERSEQGLPAAGSSLWVPDESRRNEHSWLGFLGYLWLFSVRDGFAELVDGGNLGRPQTILGDVAPDGGRVQWGFHPPRYTSKVSSEGPTSLLMCGPFCGPPIPGSLSGGG